jgi:serine/threonine protein kinase
MRAIQNIFRERHILEEIDHPLIVNLRYAFQDDENMFMVLDLMMGGDLRYHLDRLGGFSESAVKFLAAELVCSLSYLHSNKIVHRDLKPDNGKRDIGELIKEYFFLTFPFLTRCIFYHLLFSSPLCSFNYYC